jgi:hypothetical protein
MWTVLAARSGGHASSRETTEGLISGFCVFSMIKEGRFRQTKAPKWSTFFALVAMVARLAPEGLLKLRVRLTLSLATCCLWVKKTTTWTELVAAPPIGPVKAGFWGFRLSRGIARLSVF